MRIWIDLANSPHVPFFRALIPEFSKRGHEVVMTARDFAETISLAKSAQLPLEVIGEHGGREIAGKMGNLVQRSRQLWNWARKRELDLAVSHNSYSQLAAARALRLRSVTLMDYEHQPASHLAFRLAQRVIVPRAFPDEALKRFGTRTEKVRKYEGTKEDVYLADFQPAADFAEELKRLGIDADVIVVVVRPPASEALYHRFENELFDYLLKNLLANQSVKVVMLPRNEAQRLHFEAMNESRLVIPPGAVDGPNLIAASDLVVSAGGTMNREAAALGVPAATIYAGRWAAVDEELVREGRMLRLSSEADITALKIQKKPTPKPRRAMKVREQVVNLILDE